MVIRFVHTCCKLLQRQTYTCLSTRSGIWFCIGGFILLSISALHFSEILIEWSMQKYAYSLSASYDNIGGKSYQHRLCLPGPIDLVYTWVNGSDPTLIKELVNIRSKLVAEMNETKNHSPEKLNTKNSLNFAKPIDKFQWKTEEVCPYPNCVLFDAVALPLPVNVSKKILAAENYFLQKSHTYVFNNRIDPSVKVLRFKNNYDYEEVLNKTVRLNGKKIKFSKVYITSTVRNGFDKMNEIGILNDLPEGIKGESIKNALEQVNIFNTNIKMFFNMSVLQYSDVVRAKRYLGPLKNQITIDGKKFKIMPATLAWKPITPLELSQGMSNEDVSSSRFADNEELKYSLRSVDKYAPWVRNIFIVTNGQIPSWLNLDHPRVRIVTHLELFTNKSHLPTYSSPAIETHIHRITGLSKKFIYMNDDVFFGDYVWPDDFYTHSKGQKVYLTWPVPNCNEGCPAAWVNDKYCDKPCNVSECDWDGGDCLNTAGKSGWTFGKHTFTGSAYSTVGEYCNGGCANSWIGDRYCDVNCNVKDCGYDAGDCGLDNFHNLYSLTVSRTNKVMTISPGLRSFYINLTSWIGNGSLTGGEYVETNVVRTAVFSKKFKIMTVSLYANFSETILFKFRGFKDTNKTISLSLEINVTVNTDAIVKSTDSTVTKVKSTSVPTYRVLQPYTLYDKWKKRRPQMAQDRPLVSRNTTTNIYSLNHTNKDNLPLEILQQLNETEQYYKLGDITLNGYNKRKFHILSQFYTKTNGQNAENNITEESFKVSAYRIGRHLTSTGEQLTNQNNKKTNKGSAGYNSKHDGRIFKHAVAESFRKAKKQIMVSRKVNSRDFSFSTSFLPWERQHLFTDVTNAADRMKRQQQYLLKTKSNRMLLDTFANSLLHVSRIYNRAFSYKARKVPAHIPHMVDLDIIKEMQERFWPYFEETSSHKIRSPNDMQFAFSYFYYLMGVPATINASQVFLDLDKDDSGTLSDRELRTLAAQLFPLPLELKNMQALEGFLINCSLSTNNTETKLKPSLPLVTKGLFNNCQPILQLLAENTKKNLKYRYEEMGDEDVTFKMIRNNVSQLIFQLDWIRKNKRKFICLNDNIDHGNPQAKTIRTILRDFYVSMFPKQSQFELPETLRNKFLRTEELNSWKRETEKQRGVNMRFACVVIFVIVIILFRTKIFRLCRILINSFLSLGRKTKRFRRNVDIIKI